MCTATIGCSWLPWCYHISFLFHFLPLLFFSSSLFSTPPPSLPYPSSFLYASLLTFSPPPLPFSSSFLYASLLPPSTLSFPSLPLLFPSLQPDSSVVTFWDALRRATRMRDMFSLQFCPPLDIPLLDITEPRGGTMVCVCVWVCGWVGVCVCVCVWVGGWMGE